jgi:ferredoxin
MSAPAKLKVVVDRACCQGHNRCCALAPELFESDDEGYAIVIGDGMVTSTLESKARLAVVNCPEQAIHLIER